MQLNIGILRCTRHAYIYMWRINVCIRCDTPASGKIFRQFFVLYFFFIPSLFLFSRVFSSYIPCFFLFSFFFRPTVELYTHASLRARNYFCISRTIEREKRVRNCLFIRRMHEKTEEKKNKTILYNELA